MTVGVFVLVDVKVGVDVGVGVFVSAGVLVRVIVAVAWMQPMMVVCAMAVGPGVGSPCNHSGSGRPCW